MPSNSVNTSGRSSNNLPTWSDARMANFTCSNRGRGKIIILFPLLLMFFLPKGKFNRMLKPKHTRLSDLYSTKLYITRQKD